ncbi:MAG: FecR domain-containing protein [Planctomycetes bacterium]|nr:FecR domain-containing protein [Planctomycetota bacterium]
MPEPRRRGPSSLTMRHAGMWAAAALVVVWGVWFTKEQALEREVQNPGARNSSESVAVFLGPKPNADGASLMRGVERSVSAGKFDQMCLQVGGDLEIEGPASYSFASRTRCRLLSCTSARFDLPRLSGPFGVETPAGTIEVVGTKFRVTVSTDVTRVFLEQGAITLTNNLGSCRALPNSFSVMRAESPPVSMTFTEALPGWTFGRWGRRHEGDLGVALCLVGPEPRVNEDVEIGCTLQRMERDVRWPLDFEPISSASPYYLLTITPPSGSPYTINLSKCHPTEVEPLPTKSKTAGLLTLQPRQTYTVRCRIPQMFKTPGRYLVTALYGSGSALPASTTDQTWSGLIESSPITVDGR